jgi:hypothetical protein
LYNSMLVHRLNTYIYRRSKIKMIITMMMNHE